MVGNEGVEPFVEPPICFTTKTLQASYRNITYVLSYNGGKWRNRASRRPPLYFMTIDLQSTEGNTVHIF